jgi:hypothetical protein
MNFGRGEADLFAFAEVIFHTIIAAEHEGTRESDKFFRLHIESTFLVCVGVEIEDTFDYKIIGAENFLVHARAIIIELVDEVHGTKVIRYT